MPTLRRVCVFCGSSTRAGELYLDAARALARALAAEKAEVVYGGARVGLMGALADAALEAGARVVGVIPEHLVTKEVAHEGLDELLVVQSMHERKSRMHDLSDAFIALPGGLGTFEELFEIATWAQLGLHRKPIGVLDVGDYYAHLRAFLDHAVGEGLLAPEHRGLLLFDDDPARLVVRLREADPPRFEKLLGREET